MDGQYRRRALAAALGGLLVGADLIGPRRAEADAGAADAALPARLTELLGELEGLLRQRGEAGRALQAAESAERAALSDLAAHEVTLRRLLVARNDLGARVSARDEEVAALDAASGGADGGERDRIAGDVSVAQRRQAGVVDLLGQANTEIAHWQLQADRAARRVGAARSAALEASAQLAALEDTGQRRAGEARVLLSAVATRRDEGMAEQVAARPEEGATLLEEVLGEYAALLVPVPGAGTATDAERSWPPALWPSGPPPAYVPPRGAIVPILVAGAPLPAEAARLAVEPNEPTSAAGGTGPWVPPISGPVTTEYGASTPYFPTHWAVDIGAKLYAPVVAAARGR